MPDITNNLTESSFTAFLFLTSIIISGESLLLIIGMNIPVRSKWSNLKNNFLAVSDIISGLFLLIQYLSGQNNLTPAIFFLLTAFLVFTHLYRDYEYIRKKQSAFCAHLPLYIFNNIRLSGILLSALLYLLKY